MVHGAEELVHAHWHQDQPDTGGEADDAEDQEEPDDERDEKLIDNGMGHGRPGGLTGILQYKLSETTGCICSLAHISPAQAGHFFAKWQVRNLSG
jgi:hypothetical protein